MIAVGRHLAVQWRMFSTVGGYHECGGGYSVHWGDTMMRVEGFCYSVLDLLKFFVLSSPANACGAGRFLKID